MRNLSRITVRVSGIGFALVVMFGLVSTINSGAVMVGPAPEWSSPSATALKKVSPIGVAQQEPNFLNNLDCQLLTYRVVATSTMQTGCFTTTAFGMFDSDSGMAMFNGSDEALPLQPYTSGGFLIPWPKALNLISLDSAVGGGSFMSLYNYPTGVMQDLRNNLKQLVGKKLTKPAEMPLLDQSGNRLVVNSQSLAFSDNGSWLVAETFSGSFVRLNLATLDIVPFAKSYGSQGSPALLKSRVTITDDGRFVLIANDSAQEFKVYDLDSCNGAVETLKPLSCQTHDYHSFLAQQVSGFQAVRHVRFVNNGMLSLEIVSSKPDSSGMYLLAPASSIDHLIDYLGLGDSYTSGEGAFDYLAGTDLPNNMCHLSHNSYPILLTLDVFSATGGHSVACSGAVINDIADTSDSYIGQMNDGASWQQLQQGQPMLIQSILTNYLPGYMAQSRFVSTYQPKAITVQVGGNDIGFGDIVKACVIPHLSRHQSDSTCYNTYEVRLELKNLIDRTIPRWKGLYAQLAKQAPGSQIYAVGYPRTISDQGACGVNVLLNKSELEFATLVIDELNAGVKQAAAETGVSYVDISESLFGHRLCEAKSYNIAVNGLTAGKDGGILGIKLFGKESYHPNALGQQLIEQAILKQTHNFTTASTSSSVSPNSSLLSGPKTGRKINRLVPEPNLTSKTPKKGSVITIKSSGAKNGQKPKATYKVSLDSSVGQTIGQVVSNEAGDIDSSITIPIDAGDGGHTIHVSGPGLTDETIDITQPIYIPASDNDADGDGITDTLDTCPGAPNSYQDIDQDGIDDICDPLTGEVSNVSVGPNVVSPVFSPTSTSNTVKSTSSADSKLYSSTANPAKSNLLVKKPVVAHLQTPGHVLGARRHKLLLTEPKQLIYEISWAPWFLAIIVFVLGAWVMNESWHKRTQK